MFCRAIVTVFLLLGLLDKYRVVGAPRHISAAQRDQDAAEHRADYLQTWSDIASMTLEDPDVFLAESEPGKQSVYDFAKIPFNCASLPASETVPTSVHALRPGDIKVIAALGDSITAGNGVRAERRFESLIPNRGESFSVGGERSLEEESITLTNILRKYNKDLEGASYCARSRDHSYSGYNVAIPGAMHSLLESQARELVTKLAQNLDTFYDAWKVITLLIGGNDMCRHCIHTDSLTPERHVEGVKAALDIFKDHLPRAFVNLMIMADVSIVKDLIHPETVDKCEFLHDFECPCAMTNTTEEMKALQLEYYEGLNELVESGVYNERDDFTVVVQPFLRDQEPFKFPNGTIDMSFYAPDCFHPGVKTHQAFAYQLWNTMITPVGSKVFKLDESQELAYKCPAEEAPYFYTSKNSPSSSG